MRKNFLYASHITHYASRIRSEFMSKPTRREFIKTGAGALGAGMLLPVINRTAMGTTLVKQIADDAVGNGNILVIVELAGGNCGLNTIVPLQQYDIYASLRTRIGIPKDQVLPLYGSTTMGMAPSLSELSPLIDAGKMAVIQAVHYPTPNLSHDSSRTIYYSGIPDPSVSAIGRTGWIGRHSALFGNKSNSLDTVGISGVSPTLYASGATVSGIGVDAQGNAAGYQFSTDPVFAGDRDNQMAAARAMEALTSAKPYIDFVETTETDAFNSADLVAQASAAYTSTIAYPANNTFANGLKLIAKLATYTPTLGTRVYYASLGGFDTHANQVIDQPLLLQRLASGLKAFYDDLAEHGIADKVIIMVWSEFGRRVADNASDGSDHGTANNVYVLGNKIKGGTYGADPNLTDLSSGNLRFKIDFRQVYATIIQDWLGGDPVAVLQGSFGNLGFIS
jgi:uncharacterized protein (DUF1501 family)